MQQLSLRKRPDEIQQRPQDGSIFFVGTATVILRYGGYTVLTDPNFLHQGDHVHLGYGLVSKRVTEPALEIDELPPIDFVLLSHLHGDHFDRIVLRKLDPFIPIISTPAAARKLRKKGFFDTRGLKKWDSIKISKPGSLPLRITAMPGKHGPGPMAQLLPPVMGSLLEFGDVNPFKLYISGDTILYPELKEIPKRAPEIHLGLFHLGGTRIMGIYVTMDARQGVEAVRMINPQTAIPIHYNDYTIFKSPLEDFQKAVKEAGLEDRVRYLRHGETFQFSFEAGRGISEAA